MRFSPKSQEEIEAEGGGGFEPFPPGTYDFEILDASDEVSRSSGMEQIKLTVAIYNDRGGKRQIFDYLSSSPKAIFRIKQFTDAVGMSDAYDTGELRSEDMIGRTGKCKIKIERSQDYGDQNKIAMYLRPKVADTRPGMTFGMPSKPKSAQRDASLEDDAIPFAPCWQ